jgi:AraC family transcriptional regulator
VLRPRSEKEQPRAVSRSRPGLHLAAHLLRAHSNLVGARPLLRVTTGGLAPYQLRRALDRMSDTLADEPSLAELAAAVGLGPKHFARAFRQSTGLPPHQWMIHHRVARAQAMLADPAAQLSDVALACGFADQSHFTAAFRKTLGVTPGRFRRERL